MNVPRVEFDSTLEEGVDVRMLFAKSTKTYGRQRLWSQVFVAACAAVAGFISSFLRAAHAPPLIAAAVAVVVGLVAGTLSWYPYGLFHDWYIKRNIRGLVRELMGDRLRCAFEVRGDGLWYESGGTEILFAWSRLARIVDADDVELWFSPGLAVIRARAFPTAVERQQFVEAIRRHTN